MKAAEVEGELRYAVRVDFREGDHAYWGWSRVAIRAERRRRRYSCFFQGYGVRAFTVVRISLSELRQHAADCHSPLCPSVWSNLLAGGTILDWPRGPTLVTLVDAHLSHAGLGRAP